MKDVKSKVIIVTGGNGLIGREIVKELKEYEACVVSADIAFNTYADKNEFRLDLSDNDSIDQLVRFTLDNYGRIDGVINAAYPHTKDWGDYFYEDEPFEHFKRNVELQMNSMFYIDQQVAKVMIKQNFGSIVNFGSIYGIVGNDFTLYEDYNGTSPIDYCVCPGGIFDHQRKEFLKNYNHRCPMKRMGNPDDIAPLCLFLVSDGAKYITGQIIAADGGWTAI